MFNNDKIEALQLQVNRLHEGLNNTQNHKHREDTKYPRNEWKLMRRPAPSGGGGGTMYHSHPIYVNGQVGYGAAVVSAGGGPGVSYTYSEPSEYILSRDAICKECKTRYVVEESLDKTALEFIRQNKQASKLLGV